MQESRAPQTKCSIIGAQPTQTGETRRSALCQAGQTCCDGKLMECVMPERSEREEDECWREEKAEKSF